MSRSTDRAASWHAASSVSTRRKRRRVADDARDRKYGCEDTFHDHVPSLIDFAHSFDVVAEAENESASSTKRERVHEHSHLTAMATHQQHSRTVILGGRKIADGKNGTRVRTLAAAA